MLRAFLTTLCVIAAAPLPAQAPPPAQAASTPASAAPTQSRAAELFERDWVIRDWGLRFFDRDRDANLSDAEASAGAKAFKGMADADRDGRVTPQEFQRTREFLMARY